MLNPLSAFKQTFLKDVKVMGKTFTFDTSKSLKTLNKVDILVDILQSVESVNISEFDSIKEALERGLTLEQAKKQEIESWEPEIIDILVKKYIQLIKDKKPIDFSKLPDLRIYWKIRKIFSKEEVDNWSDIDYEWAVYNIQEDFKDQDEFDNRALEKRKVWMNLDLYNHIEKKKRQDEERKQETKLLVQKLMENQNIKGNYEIEIVEDNDIPTIIEE